jgi:hypothetical protein
MSGELSDISVLAVAAATLAAFIAGAAYYGVLADRLVALRGADPAAAEATPPPWKLAVELVRCALVAAVVAALAALAEVDSAGEGALLGLALWTAFPFVLLTGSVIWENVRPGLAALHAGDWLAKLLLVAVVVSVWQA